MRSRTIKVHPKECDKERLTSSPSLKVEGAANDSVNSVNQKKRQKKPYNPHFKRIMASLPSRRAGHHHNLTNQSIKRMEKAAKERSKGSLMSMLVRKSSLLLEEEQRVVGKVSTKDLEDLEREEDPLLQMEALKALPTPMGGKRIVRSRLAANPAKVLTGFDAWKYRRKLEWRRLRVQTKEAGTYLELWGSSFKRIEGMFGNGVSSYFRFLRWLFILNIAIFLLMFTFVVVPHIAFVKYGLGDVVTTSSSDNSTSQGVTANVSVTTSLLDLRQTCSDAYDVTVDTSVTQVLLDFVQGTGWMEKTMLFYGVYRPNNLMIGTWWQRQYSYNMPLAYILVTLAYLALSFYLMITHTNVTLRDQLKNSFQNKPSARAFANLAFASWDFTLSNAETAAIRHTSLFNEIRSNLEEERLEARKRARTASDLCRIVFIRALINLFVLAVLGGAAYLIYFATVQSTAFKERSDYLSHHQLVQLLMEFMPSMTITFLNFLIPLIFTKVAHGEDYHPDFEIRITLIRTVFLRLASLAVLLATIYYQIQCTPHDQCHVGIAPNCPQLRCWETYVGQNLYKLIILNFVVNVAVVFFLETPKSFIGTRCKVKIFKIVGQKSEFVIPKNVLDLVYAQTLCWLGSFFAPLIPAISTASLFILFYLKKLTVLYNYRPASRPYRSSRSQVFFMIVLLAAFFLCCVPIGYCMWKITPSYGCGPFRNYTQMYEVITIVIQTWPMVIREILGVLTSAVAIIILIIILGLLLYYYRSASRGHQEAVLILREQMMMESRDKQFLLARLNEVTGGQPRRTESPLESKPPQEENTSIDIPSGEPKNYNTFSAPLARSESTSPASEVIK